MPEAEEVSHGVECRLLLYILVSPLTYLRQALKIVFASFTIPAASPLCNTPPTRHSSYHFDERVYRHSSTYRLLRAQCFLEQL